jgi:PiT family inorganic phosphate transporter
MFGLDLGLSILLILCIVSVGAFEFINGFHDTANAVATVIYTRSLKPRTAVIWSGLWNFVGVNIGGIAVAIGIINLLPMEALVDQNVYHNVAMIMALLITAILWNLATWYFGIPCSSSHTLIGSIFGVGLAFMFINPAGGVALNWKKVIDAGLSLLVSPIFGLGLSLLLMLLFKKLVKKKKFFLPASPDKKPPFWIRSILVLTCTSVSYSHGSNDGQKGVGLVMIILISLLPAKFALDNTKNQSNMIGNTRVISAYLNKIDTTKIDDKHIKSIELAKKDINEIKQIIETSDVTSEINENKRFEVRTDIITIARTTEKLISDETFIKSGALTSADISHLKSNVKELKSFTEFAPWWVILFISVSLGLGTMIGWKRIVVTIGEKIGKSHLSYAQGASAEIVAASTITASTMLGLPVSTTHVLSSGIAGSMMAEGGIKNLQSKTIKNIAIAWIVTIPVTVALSCGLFLLFRLFVS